MYIIIKIITFPFRYYMLYTIYYELRYVQKRIRASTYLKVLRHVNLFLLDFTNTISQLLNN